MTLKRKVGYEKAESVKEARARMDVGE